MSYKMLIYVSGSLKYVAFYAPVPSTHTIHARHYLFIALYRRFTLALLCWLCVCFILSLFDCFPLRCIQCIY